MSKVTTSGREPDDVLDEGAVSEDDMPDLDEGYPELADVHPGLASAGQSGDLQGLSTDEEVGSESVQELLEEGQYFEAGIVSGFENAPPADVSEVKTRQFLEDDVPSEYDETGEGLDTR